MSFLEEIYKLSNYRHNNHTNPNDIVKLLSLQKSINTRNQILFQVLNVKMTYYDVLLFNIMIMWNNVYTFECKR